ncbi:Sedlin [Aulographum hederae CBS 113979]|uniref:Sedlin n=1 Tax=Aulographum hederae CBS 113979 TaxID=1176131 RepID=A0A6G1H6P0_9PEZI|nr:Sedlin [Aulographum hederae CBS 113979]
MSYYFAIVGTKDNPLFEHEFGTSKQGGDGIARFREEARHMNQFIVHSSLDIVEEVQWGSGATYLKHIDRFHSNYISCFLTGTNAKFLLLHNPDTHHPSSSSLPPSASSSSPVTQFPRHPTPSTSSRGSTYGTPSSSYNPTAPAVEESIKNFFVDVYDAWVKTVMSPFYHVDGVVRSPVFRARVQGAARKFL